MTYTELITDAGYRLEDMESYLEDLESATESMPSTREDAKPEDELPHVVMSDDMDWLHELLEDIGLFENMNH